MAGNGKKKWLPQGCGGRVRELPNGRFQGQLALPGNRYQSIGGTFEDGLTAAGKVLEALDKAKAYDSVEQYLASQREIADYAAAVNKPDRPRGTVYTLRWWCEKWLEGSKRYGVEAGVLENYGVWSNHRSLLDNYVLPFLGEKLMVGLTYADFDTWLQKLKLTPRADGAPGFVSAGQVRATHKLVRTILKAAVQSREIPGFDRSPLEIGLALPKVVNKKMGYPEIEVFRAIVSAADEWAADLMIWQCFSGLRLGESLALGYEDVREDGVFICKQLHTDRKIKYRGPTKDYTERTQPLALPARYALSRQLARYPDTGVRFPKYAVITDPATLIWRSEKGRFLTRSTWSNVWHEAREAAGAPRCRPHDLRRAFGNYLIDQGVEIRVVQVLLGHSNVTTTERYLGRSQKRAKAAVRLLDDFLTGDVAAQSVPSEVAVQPVPAAIEQQARVIMGELIS